MVLPFRAEGNSQDCRDPLDSFGRQVETLVQVPIVTKAN